RGELGIGGEDAAADRVCAAEKLHLGDAVDGPAVHQVGLAVAVEIGGADHPPAGIERVVLDLAAAGGDAAVQILDLDQTVGGALPDQVGVAIAEEIADRDNVPARIERVVGDDPAAHRGHPVYELNLGEPVGAAAPDQVGVAVAVEVAGPDNLPAQIERIIGEDAAADSGRAVQELDFGQPVRAALPDQIALAVAVEVAARHDLPARIERVVGDWAAAESGQAIEKLYLGQPVGAAAIDQIRPAVTVEIAARRHLPAHIERAVAEIAAAGPRRAAEQLDRNQAVGRPLEGEPGAAIAAKVAQSSHAPARLRAGGYWRFRRVAERHLHAVDGDDPGLGAETVAAAALARIDDVALPGLDAEVAIECDHPCRQRRAAVAEDRVV